MWRRIFQLLCESCKCSFSIWIPIWLGGTGGHANSTLALGPSISLVSTFTMTMISYCERISQGAGEPLNFVTNAFFVFAAYLSWKKSKDSLKYLTISDRLVLQALMILIVFVGVGSATWHYLAERWSMWLDVIPIFLFIILFLIFHLKRIFELPWFGVFGGCLGYFGAHFLFLQIFGREFLNGSVSYLAAWVSLLLISYFSFKVGFIDLGKKYLISSVVFTTSLIFRSVDQQICEIFPWGTHFLWHIFNAWLLYLLLRALGDFLMIRMMRKQMSTSV